MKAKLGFFTFYFKPAYEAIKGMLIKVYGKYTSFLKVTWVKAIYRQRLSG